MKKILRFNNQPKLNDLEGLNINGSYFENGKGYMQSNGVVMHILNTFRFQTKLEIVEATDGKYNMIMTQFLTRGFELWEMEEAFSRIGFRNPEIEVQMRLLCNELIKKGLAYWEED